MEEPVEAGPVEDVAVGEQRVVTRRQHDEPGHQERDHDRHRGNRDAAGALLQGERRQQVRARGRVLGRLRARLRRIHAHAAGLLLPAEHLEADRFLGDLARVLTGDLALVEHENAVGEREDLLQFERDQQHGAAPVALGDDAAVQVLDRAHVEPTGRLRGDQELRVA